MPDLWDESSFKMQNSCQIDPYWMTMGEAEIVGCQKILGKDGIWAEWFYNHTRWNRSEVRLHSSLSDQEGVPPLAHSLLQSCTIEGGFIVVVFHTIQMLHTLKLAGRRMLRLAQSCTDLRVQILWSSLPHAVVLHMLLCCTIIVLIAIYLSPSLLISSKSVFSGQ